jgi:hypothetical protein
MYYQNDDINRIYFNAISDLYQLGNLTGKRKELPFLNFTLTNSDKNILLAPMFAQRNWPWILRECSDRLFSIKNPGIAFRYSKNWENRQEDSGLYSYHYSDRLNGQMKELLSKNKHGRDKIVMVWNKGDTGIDGRQPCTIFLQPFMEHDNKMSMLVTMRNNDMINIFPSDIFIHSSYLKFWCIKNNIEYKNIYWVSAIAYYQKKRDKIKFVDRLINQWNGNYDNIQTTHWDKDIINDLEIKETIEANVRDGGKIELINGLKTPYVREWTNIMLMAEAKMRDDKETFSQLKNLTWTTEFAFIRDSLLTQKFR